MKYLTVQEIKSETKVAKTLYLYDLFFVVVYMIVSFMFGKIIIHSSLLPVFYLYSFFMALYLTSPSKMNRKRRTWQSIMIKLRRDTDIYFSLNTRKKEGGTVVEK